MKVKNYRTLICADKSRFKKLTAKEGDKMKEKVCKNCKYWGEEKDHPGQAFVVDGVDARACSLEPFGTSKMKEGDCAIICGHDGPIYFGSEFGCIRFEKK